MNFTVLLEERAWYFIFSHVSSVKGGDGVVRPELYVGVPENSTVKIAKVAGDLLHVSSYRGTNIIHSIECKVG